MTQDPVPLLVAPEPPAPQTLVCANCHSSLSGEYCAACGQRHEPHIHTVAHFASEAFESISHADSRLWRTLWYLFARPGFLTKEFFAGRRVAYLPPFRLYLVLSIIFFVVIGIGGADADPGTDVEKPRSAAEIAEMNALADQFAAGEIAPMSDEKREQLAQQLRAIAAESAAELEKKKAAGAFDANGPAPAAGAEAGAGAAEPDININLMTGEGVQDGIEDFCDGFRKGTGKTAEQTTKQKSVLSWCRKYGDEGFGAVGETLAHNIPKAMFIFLPLLALCMKLIYWRPKRYYVEHLLFMVHNHAFVFLVTASVMIIGLIPYVGDYSWPLYWAAFFYIAWYIYRAMRNVYGQGRWLTILKYLTMGYAYILAGAMIFLLTFIYSTITF
jgi:hypothetical protein